MKWWAVLPVVALAIDAVAFDLDPACHRYYQMFQMPDLTYENVGKIADKMHDDNCWPVLQGLLPVEESAASIEQSLPSCLDLANQVATYDSILKVFDVRPLRREDCGNVSAVWCSAERVAWRKQEIHKIKANRVKYYPAGHKKITEYNVAEMLAAIDKECNPNTSDRQSDLHYQVSQRERFSLSLQECNVLVKNPGTLDLSLPRPVNCRAKAIDADGGKNGLYIWVEQYPDGDTAMWFAPISAWRW